MNTIIKSLMIVVLCSHCTGCVNKETQISYKPDITTFVSSKGASVYKPDSASIAQHYKAPDWFRDGKLGIFIHWGPASVPAFDGWYARHMYQKGSATNKFHEEKYGPVTEFGFKDFIPMFKAENFDAEAWMKLFREAGATYVIPVAEHHDGFALYNSTYNPWNAVRMGPHRDLIKELRDACLNEGLHFGLSSHRAEHCWFYNTGMTIPSDVQDTSITLYGERIEEPDGGWEPRYDKHEGSNEHSRQNWLMHVYELIDQYQPELFYFDWTVGKTPFQPAFYQFMAYYYNNSLDWDKGVVVNTKYGFGDNIQVFDIERGKNDDIKQYPWQTDTSLGKVFWFFMENEEDLKTADHLIDDFVDIISKNGNLLLNVGPKADGTIPEKQQELLKEIGRWLAVNGDAVYGTRPWIKYGEGQKGTSGYMTDSNATTYTANDIRFTTKDNNIYIISLAWTEGNIRIESLGKNSEIGIKHISMLGSNEKIEWKQTEKNLMLKFPNHKPIDHAHVFKLIKR